MKKEISLFIKWGIGYEKKRSLLKYVGYIKEKDTKQYYDGTTILFYHYIAIFGIGFGIVFEK